MHFHRVKSWLVIAGFLLAAIPETVKAATVPGDYATIQAAITAVVNGSAPDGTVIRVQPGVYHETLLINTTSKSLTVIGVAGPASTVVDASGSGRSALRVLNAGGVIRIEGLTFRGGSAVPGSGGGFTFEDSSPVVTNVVFENNSGIDAAGGVLTRSHAQFTDCVIRANSAARFGGGMVITTGSRPTFTNCQIRDNVSGTGGPGVGSIGSGGGVHVNDASPTFRSCLITGNRSKFAGAGIMHIGGYNSVYGPALLLLEDSEVSNNVSERFSPSDNPSEGGGVHIEDNAIGYLIRTRVTGNAANTGGGLNAYRARYEIRHSVIEGNHAQDPAGVGGFGGGVSVTSNNLSMPLRASAVVVLNDSVIRNNDARIGAGIFVSGDQLCGSPTPSCNPGTALRATLDVTHSLISGNSAAAQAGGLRIDRTNVTISNSHILSNSVAASGQSYGGGILLALGSNAAIDQTTIARNASVNFGGGLFVDDAAVVSLTNSRVYANTAGSGGGVYVGNLGPPSGIVQNSLIADNAGYQVHEQACSPLQRTILFYQSNTLSPRQGNTDLYYSTCGGATTTVSGFNALPSGRATGNTSGTPSFMTFLATPDMGVSVLSWSVSRANSVTVSGVGTYAGDTGVVPVAPTSSTTYQLSSVGGPGSTANALVAGVRSWGGPTDTPVSADYDGDGKDDVAVYRQSTGVWYILFSGGGLTIVGWGSGSAELNDVPVPADYDGDGKADIAVYRASAGQWFVRKSTGGMLNAGWGAPSLGDKAVPADYDGDGQADIAVYRYADGQWFVRKSTGGVLSLSWGAPSLGDDPVPADFDGDGRADIAVYRSSNGQWFILQSSGGGVNVGWGAPSLDDRPIPADYDGDGKADITVARERTGEWFIRRSTGGVSVANWGFGDRRPVGDYDGDGDADIVIWRAVAGAWLVRP